jgi:hypothetical protein
MMMMIASILLIAPEIVLPHAAAAVKTAQSGRIRCSLGCQKSEKWLFVP